MSEPEFPKYDEGLISRYNLDFVAGIALTLIERHGMVAGFRDSEDSAGRAAVGLVPPEATVNRAFTLAELFVERAEREGRIKDLGPLADRSLLAQSYDAWRITPVKTGGLVDEMMPKGRK